MSDRRQHSTCDAWALAAAALSFLVVLIALVSIAGLVQRQPSSLWRYHPVVSDVIVFGFYCPAIPLGFLGGVLAARVRGRCGSGAQGMLAVACGAVACWSVFGITSVALWYLTALLILSEGAAATGWLLLANLLLSTVLPALCGLLVTGRMLRHRWPRQATAVLFAALAILAYSARNVGPVGPPAGWRPARVICRHRS